MITGPTPAAASRSLRAVLQQALSCLTPGVLISDPGRITNELRQTSRLTRATGAPVTLIVEHRFALVLDPSAGRRAAWQIRTAGYLYTLADPEGREILAYHWHPGGRSHVAHPHLHLGAGAGSLRRELEKAHLLTGLITPVAILTLLIGQFDVRPRRGDWATMLERARRMFEAS